MIRLNEKYLRRIQQEGAHSYPDECCGILFGTLEGGLKTVVELHSVQNRAERRQNRFLIPPELMVAAEQYGRERGMDVVGFYHSHPDCPAIPSEYDRAHALPVYSYLILSVQGGAPAELRSWELQLETLHFEEEPMEAS